MSIRRSPTLLSIALGALLASGIQPAVAQADDRSISEDSSEESFVMRIVDPRADVDASELFELADSSRLDIQTIAFSGEEGVGRLEVIPGEPGELVVQRTIELFQSVGAEVPPIVGATVSAVREDIPAEIVAHDFTVELQSLSEDTSFTPSLPVDESPRAVDEGSQRTESDSGSAAVAAGPNDWPAYFPGEWRNEARNITRCTYYANGRCWSSVPRTFLNQSVKWTGSAGSSVPWPFADWGFEFGTTLINQAMCSTSTSNQGWWLGSNYSEWSTSVPASAGPYVEGNRLFDNCAKMSHEVGIRDPQLLIQGYQYSFTVSSPRNIAQSSTKMSASYQVLHDDCLLGVALTDCMGLNTNIGWPYSTVQSAVVVNATRNFSVPGCARMYRNWSVPIQWSNGTNRLVPSPLNFHDTCLSNDY